MCTYGSKWDFSPNTTFFKFSPFPRLEWTSPHDSTNLVLVGGQFIHWLWVGQPPATIPFWAGSKKNFPFFLTFFSFKPILQTYQPHFRTWNPSSPSCIFGGPNTLMSSVSKNNAHNSISNAIACSNVSFIVSHHKLHGSQFDNNSCTKFAFHRFVWNRPKCHSSTYIVWTLILCALFRHECHMHVRIV